MITASTADNHGRSRQSERDLKIGTFAKISSPLIDLVNAAEGAAKSKADDRTRALQGLAAGAQAYQLADGVGKVADALKNQTGQQGAVLLSVEAGFGFKTAGKEQNQNYRQSRQSSLKAGGDINIRSREGDITVQGSNITAGDTIRLDSARDIRLLSAQDSQHQDGKNRNAGVQVGVGVSVGAQTGVYIYAEAAYGKGKNRSDSQTHQNTLLQSDKLQLSSKGNTVLNGAQAHAKRIDAEVGGTLHIESPQDTVEQESKQSGGGIRAQVALGTAWNVSGNYNQSKANGHSRSVGSQSGLFAGEGGYPYTVKNPVTSTFSLAKLSPNRPYLLWWYAALVKGPESGQNNLQVLFREILDRTDTGLELGKIVKELLPLPLLGQYRIGSIWIKRQVC